MRRALPVLTIVLLAVGLRAGVGLWLGRWAGDPGPLEYRTLAESLLAGEGYSAGGWGALGPSSVRTPVWALVVAAFLAAFGQPWAWLGIVLLNALAWGAAAAALTMVLVRRHRLAAGLAVACWPGSLVGAAFAQPGAATAALLLGALVGWRGGSDECGVMSDECPKGSGSPHSSLIVHRSSLRFWLIGSACGSLAGFTLPWTLPGVLAGGVAAAVGRGRRDGGAGARVALLVLVCAVPWGPWLARDVAVHAPPIVVTSALWADFWAGNNDHATGGALMAGGGEPVDLLAPARRGELVGRPESARAANLRGWAVEWIADHPLAFARLCGVRLAKWLWVDWHDPQALHPLYAGSRAVLAAVTLLAIVVGLRRREPAAFVWLGAAIVPMLTVVWTREQHVVVPVVVVAAFGALAAIRRAGQAPRLPA